MNTQSLITEFTAYLRNHDLRMTRERHHILEHIFAVHTHFEAEDLHARLKDAGHRIARATVYRTIALLVEAGMLREVIGPSGATATYYELIRGQEDRHEHLRCEDCGAIVEFEDSILQERLKHIAADLGFELTDYTVRLTGKCEEMHETGECIRSGKKRADSSE